LSCSARSAASASRSAAPGADGRTA
jgi:hypothetical protein